MNLLEIIILGIVEGLTEYLPVSSTGHLLLTESLLNMSQSKEALDALAVCMLGGMFVGLSVEAAVEFSFLLGLITLGAATVHDAYKDGALMLESFGWEALAVGTVVSWLSAWLAVKWMVSYLQKHSFAVFGWYRIAIGIVTLVLLSMGLMH